MRYTATGGEIVPSTVRERLSRKDQRAVERYRPEYAERAYRYGLMGANDTEIAKLLGVGFHDVMRWITLFPEFAALLEGGRRQADADVAFALFETAKGYSHPDTRAWAFKVKDGESETIEIVERTYVKHYPPNVVAAQFWLTNRDPANWANTSRQQLEADVSVEVKVSGISSLLEQVKAEREKRKAETIEGAVVPMKRIT